MLTQEQFREKVYNVILANPTITGIISDRLHWINKPTLTDTYPLIVYKLVDTIGGYSFGDGALNPISEDYTVQLDIYTESGDVANMDILCEQLKLTLVPQCMRLINSNVEFIPEGLQDKVVRPQRWEYINV